jgi:hypothetical protein
VHLKKPLIIEGRWHINGEGQPAHYGQLTGDPARGLSLEVKETGTFKGAELFKSVRRFHSQDSAMTVQGYNLHNHPIRLFGCIQSSGASFTTGLKTHKLLVSHGVTNMAGGTWMALKSRSYRLCFTLLDHWMNPLQRRLFQPPVTPEENVVFEAGDIKITLGAKCHFELQWATQVADVHWIGLDFPSDETVSIVYEKHAWLIALFLTLMTGDLVGLDEFNFMHQGEVGNCAQEHMLLFAPSDRGKGRREKFLHHMRAVYEDTAPVLPGMLDHWFKMYENQDMLQVLRLYSTLVHEELSVSVHFLLIAQALEAYHTACGRFSTDRWTQGDFESLRDRVRKALCKDDRKILNDTLSSANKKTFQERLQEVLADAPSQIGDVIGDPKKFVTLMKDNRNAYTHHVTERSHSKRASDRVVARLSREGIALLEMHLLRDIGAPDKALDQVARLAASGRSIDVW